MSSCYSGHHIAEDHVHTDITTRNNEEPQQKYRLRTVSNNPAPMNKQRLGKKWSLYDDGGP